MMDFPEPLYEAQGTSPKLCLACGGRKAAMVLRTTVMEVVPVCEDCSAAWRFHGYQILRRIRPGCLIRRMVLFKLSHLFGPPGLRTLWSDLARFRGWAQRMKRWTR
jgi:hypothetical protein